MPIDTMKLHHSPSSPNSRRVRVFLAEKHLPAKQQLSDAYRAINPRSVVPTLVLDDGTVIGEVPAIWRFIEESYPEPSLLGSNPKEKALITMWERRMEIEGSQFRPRPEGPRARRPARLRTDSGARGAKPAARAGLLCRSERAAFRCAVCRRGVLGG